VAQCLCEAHKRALAAAKANGGVRRWTGRFGCSAQPKGRGGKSVTLVRGLALDAVTLGALAKQLKAACGSRGTAKDGVYDAQGDHVATVMAALVKLGYAVKRSGG
jgi:translation initiation factor 1